MTTPARMLTDLAQWLPLLRELEQGKGQPRSPQPNPSHATDAEGRVPFGIRVDNTDEPADARTAAGILLWAATWAEHWESWYGRALGGSLTYLASIADQAARQHPDDWQALTDELEPIHARVAAATGHTDQDDTQHRCPSCGGRLQQAATKRGLTDSRQCATCQSWWPDGEIIDATRHHTITTTSDADVWVTRTEARNLHPGLRADLLRQWIHRGHIRTDHTGRLNLGDLNTRTKDLDTRKTAA
ncbi:hypothetical protein [Actinomyces procaprae]|uniref:hypothetical protein n=1 Tax=Actinomyces procaprae TaxID=2560010 RepID=UPI0010A213DB|nr:hypothetical protein [Actinomyces procaprae]